MLPFLDNKKTVSAVLARRGKPSVEINNEVESPESDMDPGLKEAAADILSAIQQKSAIELARAIKAAFQICEATPYEDEPQEAAGE